jgi:hypothetical protein
MSIKPLAIIIYGEHRDINKKVEIIGYDSKKRSFELNVAPFFIKPDCVAVERHTAYQMIAYCIYENLFKDYEIIQEALNSPIKFRYFTCSFLRKKKITCI